MIRFTLTPGLPVETTHGTVIPVARTVAIGTEAGPIRLEWMTPSRVLVRRDTRRSTLHITDVTRLAQLSILAAGLAGSIAIIRHARKTSANVEGAES